MKEENENLYPQIYLSKIFVHYKLIKFYKFNNIALNLS